MHDFSIKSHSSTYKVIFNDNLIGSELLEQLGTHYIIDANLLPILGSDFANNKKIVTINATEETKSYRGIEPIISTLFELGLRRDSVLVCIGGGITQDITSFIATTFMRGVKWITVPTTLLSQSDSCIGSKSSINFNSYKNLLGTFNPPAEVYISKQFLSSLSQRDFRSGIGEIIKLYLLDQKYIKPTDINLDNIQEYNRHSLLIKKRFIEQDEFDIGIRNLLNYGHCFGHGIESATDFAIPHGIAITLGMDIANRLAVNLGMITSERYNYLRDCIVPNYLGLVDCKIDATQVLAALSKDKKNTGNKINVVLPHDNDIVRWGFENTIDFWSEAKKAIDEVINSSDSIWIPAY